ncbi:MAG: LysR family transcriptional regulator [Sandaracinaceae bacterium]
MLQEPQVEDLRALVAIAQQGSLSAAARQLGVSLSTVSRQLQRLERTTGLAIADRSTRRVVLTSEGETLVGRARPILDALDALSEFARAEQGASGCVRVVAPTLLASHVFSSLGRLLDAHPALSILWSPGDAPTPDTIASADLVLQVGPPTEQAAMIAVRLGGLVGRLAAAPAYVEVHGSPARLAELSRHRVLRFRGPRPQTHVDLTDRFGETQSVPVIGAFESGHSESLRAALYAGVGVGFIVEHELHRAVEEGSLVPVLPSYRTEVGDLYALYPPSRRRLRRLQVVLAWLRGAVPWT